MTAEPLTPLWIDDYRSRVEPLLSPLQRLALTSIWYWFDALWETENILEERLRDLQADVLELFDQIERSLPDQRDAAIVELDQRLQAIDRSVFSSRL